MSNFEFRGYTPTPGEKHLGIAEIKAWGKIVLRFKIVPKKDGSGFFPVPASLKIVDGPGQERYVSAFTIDSNSDKEEAESIVVANVRRLMQPAQPIPQNFAPQPQQGNMMQPAYQQYQQPQQMQPGPFNAFPQQQSIFGQVQPGQGQTQSTKTDNVPF